MKGTWKARGAAVIVAVGLLAACGGGGDDEESTGAASTSTAGDESTTTAADGSEEGPEEEVVMPDLVGMTEDEARDALLERGIDDSDIVVDERESLDDPGTVIDQVPGSGQRISGSVNLIVAKPIGPVPDFVGQQLTEVQEWAEEREVEVRVEEVLDDGPADGEVLATTPAAGDDATSEILVKVARTPVIGQLADVEPVGDGYCGDSGDVAIDGETRPDSVYSSYDECSLEYDLGRDWQKLKAVVGLSDDSSSSLRYRFEVFVDGTSVFNQEVGLGETKDLDVSVEDGLRLRLLVTRIGDSYEDAYAVWGNIRVIGSPEQVGTDEDGSTTTTEP